MRAFDFFLILFGKFLYILSRYTHLGSGSSFPGKILLSIDSQILKRLFRNQEIKVIVVTGTNGKTTTTKLLEHILKKNEIACFRNASGANLLSGLVSCVINNISLFGQLVEKIAIFEVDENVVPSFVEQVKPSMMIFLNLFRDQLDRYGEIDGILKKWEKTLPLLSQDTWLIGNADDPQIVYFIEKFNNPRSYFGLPESCKSATAKSHLADIVYCPTCNIRFTYKDRFCGHLGVWQCPNCQFSRPRVFTGDFVDIFPQHSLHQYNALAALCASEKLGISFQKGRDSLLGWVSAFGRGEIVQINKKRCHLLLGKNPVSFTDSIKTLSYAKGKVALLILNNHYQDGRDVSWIWDVDFSEMLQMEKIILSGTCAKELQLRISYSLDHTINGPMIVIEKRVKNALKIALDFSNAHKPLFIVPTYTGLLEINNYFKGKSHLCI